MRGGPQPGDAWRLGLPAGHQEMLRRWERDPRTVGRGSERARFRRLISTAPQVQGPVYRGDEVAGPPYGIMPLDRQVERFRTMMAEGATISFARHTATSARPEIAGGFGHTVYEIHGAAARAIGNSLHEAIMPPGTYRVTHVERRVSPSRAPIDGKTTFDSDHVHVRLEPAGWSGAAAAKARPLRNQQRTAGLIDLYHHTSPAAARSIVTSGHFEADGDRADGDPDDFDARAYFSTRTDGAAARDHGSGGIVRIRYPEADADLDDVMDSGELYYSIPAHHIRPHHIAGLAGAAGPGETATTDSRRWQHGQCGTYMRALMMMRPDLRPGALGERDDPGDGLSFMPGHYFAHDGTWAYDSLGRHLLPCQRPEPYYRDQALDVLDHGIAEEEHTSPEDLDGALAAAMRHIREHHVLEGGGPQPVHHPQASPGRDVLPGDDLSRLASPERPVEWVKVGELMRHREDHHGPGFTVDWRGQPYAPKHTPQDWAANVESVRRDGIRNPLSLSWDPSTHRAYLDEGNSRLMWAAAAGHEAVPVTGRRCSCTPDNPGYQLHNTPHPVTTGVHGHVIEPQPPSAFLPGDYMWHLQPQVRNPAGHGVIRSSGDAARTSATGGPLAVPHRDGPDQRMSWEDLGRRPGTRREAEFEAGS